MNDLDVGMKCIKYMLFTTNFMFVMIGFLLISIGSTIGSVYGDFEIFMEGHYFSPSALMVAIGVIIFFVSIFGCIGAIKESTCLVNTYALFLSLILILEVSAAIASYSMRNGMWREIEENMNKTMVKYYEKEFIKDEWDFVQYNFECCGVYGKDDWITVQNLEGTTAIPEGWYGPRSCCTNETTCTFIYGDGCLSRLHYIADSSAYLVGTGAICVAIVQILGVIFANMLAKSIRRIKTENEMKRQHNRQRIYEQLAVANKEEKPTPVLYTPTYSEC